MFIAAYSQKPKPRRGGMCRHCYKALRKITKLTPMVYKQVATCVIKSKFGLS